MKITIIYDNTSLDRRLAADWGFACLVEAFDRKIMFDTGANGSILTNNMKYLGIRLTDFTDIFISHDHWDHIGGLEAIFGCNRSTWYLPEAFQETKDVTEFRIGKQPQEIHDGIWSTGTLAGIEQSLVIKQDDKVTIVTGCSHPGVENIMAAAATIGEVTALVGGLHGFDKLEALNGLSLVCPTHCTQHITEIRERFPEIYLEGGAGRIIDI
jgi:7,8-dihydropterin-6-yl-methyl-4-(beta-D-ribofuranosyl)aminobenzene 5'-phosphate synthase